MQSACCPSEMPCLYRTPTQYDIRYYTLPGVKALVSRLLLCSIFHADLADHPWMQAMVTGFYQTNSLRNGWCANANQQLPPIKLEDFFVYQRLMCRNSRHGQLLILYELYVIQLLH